MSLAPDHRADLERSALIGTVIDALQIEAVRPHDIIKLSGVQSAYRLRYFTLDGQANCFERLRLFPPITTPDGHTQNYYQTPGSAPQCYLPPFFKWKTIATDCRHTILITEGEKKSACACVRGLFAIGIAGVWNWRQCLDNGERIVVPMLDQFVWQERPVDLIPDSDVWRPEKTQSLAGFFSLAMELVSWGAMVRFVRLPDQHGVKTGLDDWLVAVGTEWESLWPQLERIRLDDEQLRPITAWWQRHRDKKAGQIQPRNTMSLDVGPILDDVHSFLCRFIVYPCEAAGVAHTLWICHTHLMDRWETTPRIVFLSPEPASGKTRALE